MKVRVPLDPAIVEELAERTGLELETDPHVTKEGLTVFHVCQDDTALPGFLEEVRCLSS